MCKHQLNFYGLNQLLSKNVVKLTFRKVNGDVVVRTATRNLEKIEIPLSRYQATSGNPSDQNELVRFYDLEDDKWKSVYVDRVLNYAILERLT